MVVIDWLQTCEFIRENSEYFILYCICGCLIGIIIILISIIIILYIEKHLQMKMNRTNIEYIKTPSFLPIYRYNERKHSSLNKEIYYS